MTRTGGHMSIMNLNVRKPGTKIGAF
jgi:hypothetical protein